MGRTRVPRTRAPSVVSNTSRTFFSSQTSLFGWEGESNLKLGIGEADSGGLEMEEAAVQRELRKEIHKIVKFIKMKTFRMV